MIHNENLELHFWDWKTYDKNKILNFLEFFFNNKKYIVKYEISYIDFKPGFNKITNNIYENKYNKKLFSSFSINNEELLFIINNKFIEKITFFDNQNNKEYFFINYSNWYIYYSYEFWVEYIDNKSLFILIKDLYSNLIKIFSPKVSNWWFSVVWENLDRIEKEKFFEWLFWYFAKEYTYDFINIDQKIDLKEWYIFLKKVENKKN